MFVLNKNSRRNNFNLNRTYRNSGDGISDISVYPILRLIHAISKVEIVLNISAKRDSISFFMSSRYKYLTALILVQGTFCELEATSLFKVSHKLQI
jgi:hypothetical protein